MKKILLTLTIVYGLWSLAAAQQDTYYTRNATLTLNGVLNGESLKLMTRELSVMLDYETAFVIIRFPISSLETEVDSLNTIIDKSRAEVVFDGTISITDTLRVHSNILIDPANNVIIASGGGSPEGNLTAGIGSTFHRTDGGAGTSLYVKESGTGNTGWIAK